MNHPAETGDLGLPPEQLASQLTVLAELGQAFAQSIDIDVTLRKAVDRIADYMGAEAASVFLIDENAASLECRACAGPVNVVGLRLDMGQGIVGRAAKENVCQMVRDAAADPDFAGDVDRETGFSTRSILCTPLRTADGVIGVLQVLNKRSGGLFDEQDRSTLQILASPTALAINNARLTTDRVEQERIRKELALARRLQKSLLPARPEDGYPVQAVNLPARIVSGDFYDYFDLPDGRIGFTVGDVSGKGINAALLMVRATSLLRWVGKSGLPPGEWLANVNEELCGTVADGMFVCAAAGYFHPRSGRVQWANAGFPPALWQRPDGAFDEFRAMSPPLAIIAQEAMPEESVTLAGGRLFFYSDGVTEARRSDGTMLAEDGFRNLIRAGKDGPPRVRLAALVTALRGLEIGDDTTLMMLEGAVPEKRLLDLEFNASPSRLKEVRPRVRAAALEAGCDEELAGQLVLVVDEAIANVIRHGYKGDTAGEVHLRIVEHDGVLEVFLRDYADPVDTSCIKPRDLSECRPGGLGLNFIDSVMDRWEFRQPETGKGNTLWMAKTIKGDEP